MLRCPMLPWSGLSYGNRFLFLLKACGGLAGLELGISVPAHVMSCGCKFNDGLLDEGVCYFDCMKDVYDVELGIKHYAGSRTSYSLRGRDVMWELAV